MQDIDGYSFQVRGEMWFFDLAGRLIYPRDPAPYDPCWCGAPAKFRFCHMRRHNAPRPTEGEWIALFEKSASLKLCLHPSAPEGCASKIVGSHSIQRRGGGLKTIARDGKVYGFKHHLMFLEKNRGRLIPELLGLATASTFSGFCEAHDSELFRAAEASCFEWTQEQLARLNYRAIARQLYADMVMLSQPPLLATMDRGRSAQEQRRMFVLLEHYRAQSAALHERHSSLKKTYGADLLAQHYDDINAVIVVHRGAPEYMCAGLPALDFSVVGEPLPASHKESHVCLYTVALPSGFALVLAWRGKDNAAEALAASLFQVSYDELADILMRYALEYLDNLFFAPQWWEALTAAAREAISERISRHISPLYRRAPNALQADGLQLSATAIERIETVGAWKERTTT